MRNQPKNFCKAARALFLDVGAVRKTPINKPMIKPAMVPVIEIKRVIPVPRKNCGPLSFKIFIIWLKKVCSSSLASLEAGCFSIMSSMSLTWSSAEILASVALTWSIRLSPFFIPIAMVASSSPTSKPFLNWIILNFELADSAVKASGRSET